MLHVLLLVLSVVSASIKGPEKFGAGELGVLDGSGSQGDKLQWVIPPQFSSLPSRSMKVGLTCDVPGKYVVLLVAVDKDLEIAVASHEITITGEEKEE